MNQINTDFLKQKERILHNYMSVDICISIILCCCLLLEYL